VVCIEIDDEMSFLRPSSTLLRLTAAAPAARQFWKQKQTYSSSASSANEMYGMFERLNWDRLKQEDMLVENLKRRDETANVDKLRLLWKQLQMQPPASVQVEAHIKLEAALVQEALRLPNDTHKAAIDCGDTPKVIRTSGEPLSVQKPKELHEVKLNTTNSNCNKCPTFVLEFCGNLINRDISKPAAMRT